MTHAASHSGVLRALLRERRVFAILALLLLALPALTGPALSAAGQGDPFAVCSATGLVAADAGTGTTDSGHDGLACCGTLCHHSTALAGGEGGPRLFARVAHPFLQAIPAARAPAAFVASRPNSIRAPPAAAS